MVITNITALIRILPLFFLFFLLLTLSCFSAEKTNIKIGVLSFRTPEQTLSQWVPTADYLSLAIPGYRFEMLPMNYLELDSALSEQSIDFVLTNTAHYITLEAEYGVSRIVTLVKSFDSQPLKSFGGVIFTRSDRDDINTLYDLRGKKFLAVGPNSLGGFLVAWQQFKQAGINPFSEFSELIFNGLPHDDVVFKVLDRQVDGATVRTHVLENMAKEQKIDLADIKVINQKTVPDFPYLLSTELYPEWPLARLPYTDDTIVEKVIVALLTMGQNDPAKKAGGYDRWTPPLNYQGVHELFKELQAGPYKDFGAFTVTDVFHKYLDEILIIIVLFLSTLLFMVKIIHLNDSLKKALSEVKTLRGFLPICSSCKKIRDDTGYWNRIETYIRQHSDAEFSHSICPDCAQRLFTEYNNSVNAVKEHKKNTKLTTGR